MTVLIHAWAVKVVRVHRTVSTGNIKGAHPLAITRYVCDRCGETLPENTAPPPWWTTLTGAGPWTIAHCRAPAPRHIDPALETHGLVEET